MDGEKIANPAPLGLLGFGMTTVLLNLHNAGILPSSVVLVAMGFALGGAAQIIAGLLEYKKNNVFGATAFTAYGLFWWSLIFIWCNPFGNDPATVASMGFYLLLWGIFTLVMAICTLKHNRATQIVFFSLALLFFLLSWSDFLGEDGVIIMGGLDGKVRTWAGIVGIFCGASAIYTGLAQVVNHEFGRKVLPL